MTGKTTLTLLQQGSTTTPTLTDPTEAAIDVSDYGSPFSSSEAPGVE